MPDMLVRLYALPPLAPALAALAPLGIELRAPHTGEKQVLADWVRQHFNAAWAGGCESAFEHQPVSCAIAVVKLRAAAPPRDLYDLPPERLLGFACYDVAALGMFGALGVHPDYRRRGLGTALLLTCLHAMKTQGYAYAAIGWAGSVEFYARAAGATVIPDSEPGIFRGPLVP